MKQKLVFNAEGECKIDAAHVGGEGYAEHLRGCLSILGLEKKTRPDTYEKQIFSDVFEIVNVYSEICLDLSEYYEVVPDLLSLVARAMAHAKKIKAPKNEERYQKMLRWTIINFRTAADEVLTDNIPNEEKRQLNLAYAYMAQSYLAEYLRRPMEAISGKESNEHYERLYRERAGIASSCFWVDCANDYREGRRPRRVLPDLITRRTPVEESLGAGAEVAPTEKDLLLPEQHDVSRGLFGESTGLRRRYTRGDDDSSAGPSTPPVRVRG